MSSVKGNLVKYRSLVGPNLPSPKPTLQPLSAFKLGDLLSSRLLVEIILTLPKKKSYYCGILPVIDSFNRNNFLLISRCRDVKMDGLDRFKMDVKLFGSVTV